MRTQAGGGQGGLFGKQQVSGQGGGRRIETVKDRAQRRIDRGDFDPAAGNVPDGHISVEVERARSPGMDELRLQRRFRNH